MLSKNGYKNALWESRGKIMSETIIRPIAGFPGYLISNKGDVYSTWKQNGRKPAINTGEIQRKLKPSIHKYGHVCARLSKNQTIYDKFVHRLALETFVGPCPEGMETCHNNGDPTDNRIENLRWDTHKANFKDAIQHQTLCRMDGEKNGMSRLTENQIREIRKLAKERTLTQKEIAEKFSIHEETVGRIHRRKRWKYLE